MREHATGDWHIVNSSYLRQALRPWRGVDGKAGIYMALLTENPFAALTIIVAPAILTNASSVLCLGTANRLARVVDRTRVVSAELARVAPNATSCVVCRRQLEALRARWTLVLRALKLFYMSVGSFAAATLISLFGAVFASSDTAPPFPFHRSLRPCFRHTRRRRVGFRLLHNGAGDTAGSSESRRRSEANRSWRREYLMAAVLFHGAHPSCSLPIEKDAR